MKPKRGTKREALRSLTVEVERLRARLAALHGKIGAWREKHHHAEDPDCPCIICEVWRALAPAGPPGEAEHALEIGQTALLLAEELETGERKGIAVQFPAYLTGKLWTVRLEPFAPPPENEAPSGT